MIKMHSLLYMYFRYKETNNISLLLHDTQHDIFIIKLKLVLVVVLKTIGSQHECKEYISKRHV